MRRASDVIWSAATDKREARECKEGGERLILLQGRAGCVCRQSTQQPYPAAVIFIFKFGEINYIDDSVKKLSTELGCCQSGLQTSVRNDQQQ